MGTSRIGLAAEAVGSSGDSLEIKDDPSKLLDSVTSSTDGKQTIDV